MNVVLDPVHVSQRTFRSLLAALSHPGRVIAVEDEIEAPDELGAALAVSALTLFDRDVSVWIAPHERPGSGGWLVAQTGCRLVDDPRDAQFAVILDPVDALPLGRWNAGSADDPESSTTLLVRVAACSGGSSIALSGPGIELVTRLAVCTLPERFWSEWAERVAGFPLGVDCFLFDAGHVVGLARTTMPQAR